MPTNEIVRGTLFVTMALAVAGCSSVQSGANDVKGSFRSPIVSPAR
jgi:hypothetical protein